MMTMMNQTSSKNLLLCLLLYLIREDGKDDKDEVKCRLVSPKAFLCIKSDIEKICVPQKKCLYGRSFFSVCVFKKPQIRKGRSSKKSLEISSFLFASSFFFRLFSLALFFGEKVSSEKISTFYEELEK